MKPGHTSSPMTARELLEAVAGEQHAEHTVVRKEKRGGFLRFWCSCGPRYEVPDIDVHRLALRNVADVAS